MRFFRKVTLLIVAIMIGVSNVIYEEDKMINGNNHPTEQLQEKDNNNFH